MMRNDLTTEQLAQPIQVTLPLSAVLALADTNQPPEAVRAKLKDLQQNRPAIGSKGLYGIYAGIAVADEHGGDHILELLDEVPPKKMNWADAKAWAESIGGTLPTRKEQALLFANVGAHIAPEWHWSCEERAGLAESAWLQLFGYGFQDDGHKSDEFFARAVRRLSLESLND